MATRPPSWVQRPVEYASRLDARDPAGIRRVVVHCTELPDLAAAREYAERIVHRRSRTGNCGHFYVDRDGTIEQWVPLERAAHHVRDHNHDSIGIELVNRGRYPDWYHSRHQRMTESYPAAQVAGLVRLLADLRKKLPGLVTICGHEDLDQRQVPASDDDSRKVQRKLDPGPLFPWDELIAACGLVRWRPADD